jgi:hypothetical protein
MPEVSVCLRLAACFGVPGVAPCKKGVRPKPGCTAGVHVTTAAGFGSSRAPHRGARQRRRDSGGGPKGDERSEESSHPLRQIKKQAPFWGLFLNQVQGALVRTHCSSRGLHRRPRQRRRDSGGGPKGDEHSEESSHPLRHINKKAPSGAFLRLQTGDSASRLAGRRARPVPE